MRRISSESSPCRRVEMSKVSLRDLQEVSRLLETLSRKNLERTSAWMPSMVTSTLAPPTWQPPNHPTTQPSNHPTTQPPNNPTTQPPNPPTTQPPNHPTTQPPNHPATHPPNHHHHHHHHN